MAVRGINPFEKNIEKIFLALAAAGLTGVVAWQAAGWSETVKVGTEDVPADQAYGRINTKAQQLMGQMRETSPSTPAALKSTPDLLGDYRKHMVGAVAPSPSIAYAPPGLPQSLVKDGGPTQRDPSQFYQVPVLPMAAKPIVHPFMSTIHEADVRDIVDLAKYVPASGPHDKAAVSIETTIDPKAIRAALEQDPDGPGPVLPLVRNWWANTEVVEVELVRQELKPDGTWGGEIATPVLPGRKNFTHELDDPAINSQALAQIVTDASASMEELLRPTWYRRAELGGNVVGDEWVQPVNANKQVGGGELSDLQRKRKGLAERLQNQQRALDNLKKQPPRPPGAGGGGGGRSPRPGGGGGVGNAPPRTDPRDQQIKDLEKQIEITKKLIEEIDAQIAAQGGKADTTAPKAVVKDNDLSILLSSSEPITVWHHDVDAVRGATYRYDLRIKVNNPLFNRGGQLKDPAAAKSPTLSLASGGWSDPVHVDDEVYSFITSASPSGGAGGGTGLGNAQAMLFYYTWGYWRSSAPVSLEPGDGMVAHWTVPDETKINAAPNAAPPPAAPVPGGRRPMPGGGAIAPAAGGGGGGAPGGNAPAGAAGSPLPTKEVTKERDAFLLDVMVNPLVKNKNVALIRDVDKMIVVKDPEEQKASDVFKRLSDSAAAGRQQLAGQGTPAQPGNAPPVAPANPVMPPMNPNGGGGGG